MGWFNAGGPKPRLTGAVDGLMSRPLSVPRRVDGRGDSGMVGPHRRLVNTRVYLDQSGPIIVVHLLPFGTSPRNAPSLIRCCQDRIETHVARCKDSRKNPLVGVARVLDWDRPSGPRDQLRARGGQPPSVDRRKTKWTLFGGLHPRRLARGAARGLGFQPRGSEWPCGPDHHGGRSRRPCA